MMFPAASDMKLPGLLSFDSEDVANLLLALAREPGMLPPLSGHLNPLQQHHERETIVGPDCIQTPCQLQPSSIPAQSASVYL